MTVLGSTERKGWREYAGEFAMLFLAVTLGFVVDNFRERLGDRERERVLMRQVLDDLRADRVQADANLALRRWRAAKMDSLLDLHEQGSALQRLPDLYYLTQIVRNRYMFTPTHGAFAQLENAGGSQLITRPLVLESLRAYRAELDVAVDMQHLEEDQIQRYRNGPLLRMFDPGVLRRITHSQIEDLDRRVERPSGTVRLVDRAPATLNEHFMLVLNMLSFNGTCTRLVTGVSQRAEKVAALIEREYGFNPG